jgi:phosphoribosylaminoimidazolecarboxamide formyltransferase/IMP cyclohydrolase
MRGKPEHMQALAKSTASQPIDMVVVNLYRFEDVAAKGGCAPRGAHREHRHRRTNHDPRGRQELPGCRGGGVAGRLRAIVEEMKAQTARSLETRWRLAQKAFRTTADYDAAISARLANGGWRQAPAAVLSLRAPKLMDLRYGENPHQSAALYGGAARESRARSSCTARNSPTTTWWIWMPAWQLAAEFRAAAAIIKHTNPCGCAEQGSLAEATARPSSATRSQPTAG